MAQIILASASPRRAELLDQVGIRYRIQATDIIEDHIVGESPSQLVERLAIEKSQALANADLPVLGADTLGVLEGQLLLKPNDLEDAKNMLRRMSGHWHEILSAVAITHAGKTYSAVNYNKVLFSAISEKQIEAYWKTGEPRDKAGSYAIQGIFAAFIERIEGSYSGIMGLPLFETCRLLQRAGISIL